MAVPWCWLEKTGMSAPFSRLSAMVKARGAEMSSRQMAPKVEESARPVSTMPSGSEVARESGKASTPAKVLKMTLLASSSGMAASGGPDLPTEDIRAVGEDGDGVAAAGEIERRQGILVDGETGFGDAGGVDEGEDGPVADGHLRTDADQSLIAPPIIEPFLLELSQGRTSRDWLDRGRHTGHATVPGFDLLASGGFARACHQRILRRVARSAAKHL